MSDRDRKKQETSEREAATADQLVMEDEPAADTPDAGADEALPDGEGATVSELQQLRSELKETRDRLLRQAAEYQNFRRRSEAEVASAAQYGRAQVILNMLEVYDDFERSLEAAQESSDDENNDTAFETLVSGLELVRKKFFDRLQSFGVEQIEAIGQPFHEDEHEALLQQPAPEGTEEGTVIGEVQKGYKLGDRVLRHAKVIVAK